MKISGRNIKRRLYGVSKLKDRVLRARYFRGHGVHSPFVYSVVRQVFMCSHLNSDDTSLHDALLALGVTEKKAVQLQNLYAHCGYSSWAIDRFDTGLDMVVVSQHVDCSDFEKFIESARLNNSTLVVLSPYMNRERDAACREIVARHCSTTIDNRGYLLIFNNYLPKQHFKL